MSSRDARTGLPEAYAREKRRMLEKRWEGPAGDALRRMVPRAWPGVPALVFLGFTGFSTSPRENTTTARPDQEFHEVGLFQVEAGLRDGPAPNPDPRAEYNAWGALHDDPLVRELLGGRDATMRPGAWADAIDDQVAVGLANLLRHGAAFARAVPELAPRDAGSLWAVATAFTTFSRGRGQSERVMATLAAKIAGISEAARWTVWAETLCLEALKGADGIDTRPGRKGAGYGWARTHQKLTCGRIVAQSVGDQAALDWYGPDLAPSTALTLTRLAYP